MSESTARASRCWSAYFSATTVILLYKYVTPWAAWGWSVGLLVLALIFDFGIEVRRVR